MAKTNERMKFGFRSHDTPVPGCELLAFRCYKYWTSVIKHYT